MRPRLGRWALRALLFWGLVGAPVSARAGDVSLDVCNKGKIAIDVFLAMSFDTITVKGWDVSGHRIKPATCERVYGRTGFSDRSDDPAYLAFGVVDRKGQYQAGRVKDVPDLGVVKYGIIEARVKGGPGHQVLTRGEKQLCVRWAGTAYKLEGELEVDCTELQHQDGSDVGQYVPVTTSLYFRPQASWCSTVAGQFSCVGGDYYLNVIARPDSPEVIAVPGTAEGADAPVAVIEAPPPQLTPEEQRAKDRAEYARLMGRFGGGSLSEAERRKSVGEVSAQSLGQPLIVKGTVTRVQELIPWAILYFQESPSGAFVVCYQPTMFGELGGKEHSGLIGKQVEVRAQLTRPRCAPGSLGMTLSTPAQIAILSQP